MSTEELKEKLSQLLMQRSALKDNIEQTEKLIGQLSFALNVLEAQKKAAETPTE